MQSHRKAVMSWLLMGITLVAGSAVADSLVVVDHAGSATDVVASGVGLHGFVLDPQRGRAVLWQSGRALTIEDRRRLEDRGLRVVREQPVGGGVEAFQQAAAAELGSLEAPGLSGMLPVRWLPPSQLISADRSDPVATMDNGSLTVVEDDFEGPLEPLWSLWVTQLGQPYTWGRTTCSSAQGAWSVDGSRGGPSGAQLCCGCSYPQGRSLLALENPISVSGLSEPVCSVSLRGRTSAAMSGQTALDALYVIVSIGAPNESQPAYGYRFFGDGWDDAWNHVTWDMTDWHGLGDLRQLSRVLPLV